MVARFVMLLLLSILIHTVFFHGRIGGTDTSFGIAIGMSKWGVFYTLGMPVKSETLGDNECQWEYAWGTDGKFFVTFDRDGSVCHVGY